MMLQVELRDLIAVVIAVLGGSWAIFHHLLFKPLDKIWNLLGEIKDEQAEQGAKIAVLEERTEHL